MQRQAGSRSSEPRAGRASMDRYRAAPKAKPDQAEADDDSGELGVFAAERYFYGDDALWPWERSSSSLSSTSAFRTGTHEHEHDRSVPTPTAVTSSSEASWNSRSALLPNEPPEKLRAVAAAVADATPIIEARPSGAEGQQQAGPRAASSSNLRRWLIGVAACACARGGASEESASADEMETSERCPKTEVPEATAARSSVTPASGRWLLEGDKTTLAGMEAFSSPNPIQPAGNDGHRRATNLGEILHPQAAAISDSDERWRIKSLETFRAVPVGGECGSALGPSATQSSAFTIVAGNTALGGDAPRAASGGGGGSPGEDDDAAPSELGCVYPPSEASVVWSVVTADGAASGNFSSAASGYYYHHYYSFNDVGDGAMRRHAARNTHKRRSGIAGGSSLLTCISDKAVDAVGPARSVRRQEVHKAAMAMLGASGSSRNGHDGVYQDVIRRR